MKNKDVEMLSEAYDSVLKEFAMGGQLGNMGLVFNEPHSEENEGKAHYVAVMDSLHDESASIFKVSDGKWKFFDNLLVVTSDELHEMSNGPELPHEYSSGQLVFAFDGEEGGAVYQLSTSGPFPVNINAEVILSDEVPPEARDEVFGVGSEGAFIGRGSEDNEEPKTCPHCGK